jgi:hypothetical protein
MPSTTAFSNTGPCLTIKQALSAPIDMAIGASAGHAAYGVPGAIAGGNGGAFGPFVPGYLAGPAHEKRTGDLEATPIRPLRLLWRSAAKKGYLRAQNRSYRLVALDFARNCSIGLVCSIIRPVIGPVPPAKRIPLGHFHAQSVAKLRVMMGFKDVLIISAPPNVDVKRPLADSADLVWGYSDRAARHSHFWTEEHYLSWTLIRVRKIIGQLAVTRHPIEPNGHGFGSCVAAVFPYWFIEESRRAPLPHFRPDGHYLVHKMFRDVVEKNEGALNGSDVRVGDCGRFGLGRRDIGLPTHDLALSVIYEIDENCDDNASDSSQRLNDVSPPYGVSVFLPVVGVYTALNSGRR